MKPIIQSLWIGRPLSLLEQLSITSFLRRGHEYHLYRYGEIQGVPAGTVLRDASEILPATEVFHYRHGEGKGSVSAFTNWFRYKLLLERGGWWCDTDVVCLRPFDFPEDVVFASEYDRDGSSMIATAVIKLPAGHPVARECCQEAMMRRKEDLTWGKTGSALLGRVIRENHLQSRAQSPETFCPVFFLDWLSLVGENSDAPARLITPQTRAIHFWHEMWRRAGLEARIGGGKPRLRDRLQALLKPSVASPGLTISPSSIFAELLRQNGLRS